MEDQSEDWAEFARVQEELKNSTTSNDRQWGLEYALDKTLDDIAQKNSFDRSDTERRIQTGARKNRHRKRLLRLNPITWLPDTCDPSSMLDARSQLQVLKSSLTDFDLLEKVAAGNSYAELSETENAAPASLRKRASRARQRSKRILQD